MKFNNLALLLLLILGALGLSSCQSPSGAPASSESGPAMSQKGGGDSAERRERALARNQQTLDDLRAKKKTKDEVLSALRDRLQKHGGTDIDERVKKAGEVIDEALALDDAAFTQKKEALARRLGQSMRGGHRSGEGGREGSAAGGE